MIKSNQSEIYVYLEDEGVDVCNDLGDILYSSCQEKNEKE